MSCPCGATECTWDPWDDEWWGWQEGDVGPAHTTCRTCGWSPEQHPLITDEEAE